MKNDIVECVHWDPEVDPVAQAARQKNKWVLLAGALVVLAVAVVVSLLFFLPRGGKPPVEPPPETGQADLTEAPTQTQRPPEENPLLTQGIAYYNSQNYAAALDLLNRAVAALPDPGVAYTYRGLTQFALQNYPNAEQDFTQAMIRMGKSAELLTLRGMTNYQRGWYSDAIGDLTDAIKLDPGSSRAYEQRALAYDATGRMDLAAADRAAALQAGIGG